MIPDLKILKQLPISIAVFNLDMQYIGYSQKWLDEYHLSENEIIGKSQYDIFPEIDDEWRFNYNDCLLNEVEKNGKNFFIGIDNKVQFLQWNICPWFNEKGKISGIIVYTENIFERKKIEQLNEEMIGIAHMGGWDFDVINQEIYWTPEAKQIHEVEPYFVPDLETSIKFFKEGESQNSISRIIALAIEKGEPWDTELQIITAKGNERWIRTIGKAEFINHKCVRLYGTLEDITVHKVQELTTKQLAEIVESSEDAIIKTDLNNIILTWNSGASNMFQYSRDEIIGSSFFQLIPDDKLAEESMIITTIQRGESLSQFETVRITRDKRLINISKTISPIRNAKGDIIGTSRILRNITDSKQKHLSYQKISDRLSLATKAAGIGIWEYDRMLNALIWDDHMFNLYGIHPDNFTGDYECWKSMIHPEDRQKCENEFNRAINGEMEFDSEFRIVWPDGTVKNIKALAFVDKDPKGKVLRMIGTNWDITEIRTKEQMLINNENKYRSIIENSSNAILLTTRDGKIEHANSTACKLFGYDLNEFKLIDRKKIIELSEEYLNKILLSRDKDGHVRGELTGIRKNGERFPIEYTSTLITDMHGNIEANTSIVDITERKKLGEKLLQSEEQFRGAFEHSAIGMALISPEGKWLKVNQSLCDILGYNEEELNKLTFQDITYPDDLEADLSHLQDLISGKRQSYTLEKRYYHKKGHIIWIVLSVSMVKDKEGKPIHFVSQIKNITERKQAEFSLKKNAEQLKELNEYINEQNKNLSQSNIELEQFAYIASHDMQEPLRMITGFLTKLEAKFENKLDPKALEYIKYAVDGAKRMRNLITDLLDYSKVGSEAYEVEAVDINKLLKDVVFLQTVKIQETDAYIEWNEMPIIEAASIPLQQLFSNLINNALKYIKPDTRPLVRISVEDKKEFWQFAIADNGIGIESQYFEKVFTIFQRLHNKEEFSGTGIGLSICKKIVRNFGGDIWIESVPNIGTTFFFTVKKRPNEK